MSLTPEQLDNLEALAREATPGPYVVHPFGEVVGDRGWTVVDSLDDIDRGVPENVTKAEADAAYFAALSPDVVKALTAEVRELRSWQGAARAIMDACDDAPDDCPSCRYVVVKRQEARL